MSRAALFSVGAVLAVAALLVACGSDAPQDPEPDPWCRISGQFPCLDFPPDSHDGGFTLDSGRDGS